MRNFLGNTPFRDSRLYLMMAADGALFLLSLFLAYLFRFEFAYEPYFAERLALVAGPVVLVKLAVFLLLGLYKGMWRYTGTRDFWRLLQASAASTLLVMAAILVFFRFEGFSRAVFLMDGGLTFLLAGGLRMAVRSLFAGRDAPAPAGPRRRVLIVGAGDAGEKILREIMGNNQLPYEAVGFIDDDPRKKGREIHGVPVLGDVTELPAVAAAEEIDEILIAVPSAGGEQIRRIVAACKDCRLPYKTLPGIGELIDGRVGIKALRDVNYEDLLGRSPVDLRSEEISGYLAGRTILITGCGGSIGAELCRQIVRFGPGRLVLLDAGEANLFHISLELERELGFAGAAPVLGRVQDEGLVESLFRRYRPEVVFHAAAYKHVPMLELNPWEAVENNIRGSGVVMEAACRHGAERFVLVSTDKAVRPVNVMGASKRVTELMMQAMAGRGVRFMAVRFGNVVGSSGSVIPVFRRQIELGGPVTVTHPEVTRFFMTIPEAAQLILQAGAMGQGGEIFILKMGRPVRIADMAVDLIRLSGKEPGRDVQVVFTGLRPGEKLYEELISEGEGIVPTGHDKIMVLRPDGPGFLPPAALAEGLKGLYEAAGRFDAAAVKALLASLVPEYRPEDCGGVL